MTKNSKEKLLRHPSVREVVDEFHVICKCGKKIKLDHKFDPDFLERHSKSSACKLTNNATQITNFFDKKTSNARRKLCHGLNNEKTKIYLSRHQNIPNRSDLTSTLNSSIISHHISYLTNNSDTYNQPKSRLQHWGIRQRFQQINSLLPNNNNDSSSKLIFDFAFEILIKY